jgi:hypothetical protein
MATVSQQEKLNFNHTQVDHANEPMRPTTSFKASTESQNNLFLANMLNHHAIMGRRAASCVLQRTCIDVAHGR